MDDGSEQHLPRVIHDAKRVTRNAPSHDENHTHTQSGRSNPIRKSPGLVFMSFFQTLREGAPFPEVLQYRVDAWSGRSKPLFRLPVLKINLIYSPHIEDVSDIKLIRTDTTLDLSQKAEKR